MAVNVKKSLFGKNALRISSMLLAVVMLVLSVFTGVAPVNVKADTTGLGNLLKIKSTVTTFFGQNVILEAGEKYSYSYYYSSGSFIYGQLLDGNDNAGANGATVTITNTIYDDEYNKVTYEFIAPENATDAGEGKVRIYLGIAVNTAGANFYYYGFNVHAVDDESKTNLFNDPYLTSNNSLANGSLPGNWYKPYSVTEPGSKLNWDRYYNDESLESKGGLDYFKKTDADRYAVTMSSAKGYIGQIVSLKAGKTYVFSNCYSGYSGNGFQYQKIFKTDYETNIDSEVIYVDDSNDWFRESRKFTVPEDAVDDPAIEGNKLVYVAVQGHGEVSNMYYYDFELYDIENPEVNLLKDAALQVNGSGLNGAEWRTTYDREVNSDYVSKVPLSSIEGGINVFKKTDADRYAVKMAAGSAASKAWFGQKVSLKQDKTYIFSYYYTGPYTYPKVFNTDTWAELSDCYVVYDNDWLKQSVKFTVPEDAPEDTAIEGNRLIYVGIQGFNASTDLYYYNFELYDAENPSVNILNDGILTENGTSFNTSVWMKPSGSKLETYFSKVTVADAGGVDIFKKTDVNRHVLKLSADTTGQPWFGQWMELEKGKTYTFSNYFLAGTGLSHRLYYYHDNGEYDSSDIEGETTFDSKWSEISTKFTVPDDAVTEENGKVRIWVGMRGSNNSYPTYFYNFGLYDNANPEINLLKDYALAIHGTDAIDSNTWQTPNGEVSTNYSKTTLAYIGGINTFLSLETKCDVNGDGKVDICDLVRMKRYQDKENTDAEILDGRGDLDNDGNVALDGDLLFLKKELLKN